MKLAPEARKIFIKLDSFTNAASLRHFSREDYQPFIPFRCLKKTCSFRMSNDDTPGALLATDIHFLALSNGKSPYQFIQILSAATIPAFASCTLHLLLVPPSFLWFLHPILPYNETSTLISLMAAASSRVFTNDFFHASTKMQIYLAGRISYDAHVYE